MFGKRYTYFRESAGSLTLVVRQTEYVRERVYRMDDPARAATLVTGGDRSV